MSKTSPLKLAAPLALAIAPFAAGFAPAANAAFDLTGIDYVQYGDAQSYSLPIACMKVGQAYNKCDYNVDSTPGAIKDLVVIYTGSSGDGVTTNFTGMDDAYHTPSGSTDNYFQTGGLDFPAGGSVEYGTSDPNGAGEFTGDAANTWDTTLSDLNTFLAGGAPVFFFNNNQVKNLGTAGETLAAWMQVSVEWVDPKTGATEIRYFDLTNDGGKYALVSEGGGGTVNGNVGDYENLTGAGPDGNSNTNTDYVLSGGALCVIGTPPLPVPCSTPGSTGPINHNLGADHAAYAILFPELNLLLADLLADGIDGVMHVDLRLGCDPTLFGPNGTKKDPNVLCTGEDTGWGKNLNNGYEQLFLTSTLNVPPPPPVPVPGSLGLLAGGLLGLGALLRRGVGNANA